jgi:hypothetical protein
MDNQARHYTPDDDELPPDVPLDEDEEYIIEQLEQHQTPIPLPHPR